MNYTFIGKLSKAALKQRIASIIKKSKVWFLILSCWRALSQSVTELMEDFWNSSTTDMCPQWPKPESLFCSLETKTFMPLSLGALWCELQIFAVLSSLLSCTSSAALAWWVHVVKKTKQTSQDEAVESTATSVGSDRFSFPLRLNWWELYQAGCEGHSGWWMFPLPCWNVAHTGVVGLQGNSNSKHHRMFLIDTTGMFCTGKPKSKSKSQVGLCQNLNLRALPQCVSASSHFRKIKPKPKITHTGALPSCSGHIIWSQTLLH